MNRLCLDTSAYSHFLRGHEAVVEVLNAARMLCVPTVVLGELQAGFLLGGKASQNEESLARFLANPIVRVSAVDEDVARLYAEVWVELRAAGTPVPTNDVWIAAVAARQGATVVTYDEHFRKIGRVGSLVLSVAP